MDTYLFAWNPARWEWDDLEESLARVKKRGYVDERWSCGNRKTLPVPSGAGTAKRNGTCAVSERGRCRPRMMRLFGFDGPLPRGRGTPMTHDKAVDIIEIGNDSRRFKKRK